MNAGFGCIAAFMLPFLAAGVFAIYAGMKAHARGDAQWLIPVAVGGAFVIFAIGFVSMPLYAIRRSRADAAALDQGVIVDRGGASSFGTFVFAIMWNAIAFTIAFFLVWRGLPARDPVPLWVDAIVMIFPAIGVILMITAGYQLVRRYKYGSSRLMLDHLPVATGTTFRGNVDTHLKEAPESGFVLRLMCIRRVVTGAGRSRSASENVLWADEQTVGSAAAMRNPLGTRIPFMLTIPDDARPTDDRDASDSIAWRIAVKAEVPGIDYAADFQFPVVSTGERAHAPTSFAVPVASATSWVPSPGSHIAITPLPAGGEEIRVTTRPRASETLFLLLFAAFWYGILGVVMVSGKALFVPLLFGVFGLLVVAGILDNLLGRSVIRTSSTALTLRREYPFGLGTGQTIATADIESVSSNLALASQSAPSMYTVDVTLRNGTHVQAAKAIRDRHDAEMLAARVRGAGGGKNVPN